MSAVAALVGTIASILTFCWSIATFRSDEAQCPAGWWINGVTRDGRYECRSPTAGQDCGGSKFCESLNDPAEIRVRGRVWCGKGEVPVQDGTRIWCRRP